MPEDYEAAPGSESRIFTRALSRITPLAVEKPSLLAVRVEVDGEILKSGGRTDSSYSKAERGAEENSTAPET